LGTYGLFQPLGEVLWKCDYVAETKRWTLTFRTIHKASRDNEQPETPSFEELKKNAAIKNILCFS